jgi:hypothetical protein
MAIYFRPLTYEEITSYNIDNFSLQKMLLQLSTSEDTAERNKIVDEIYTKMSHIQASIFVASIEQIVLQDGDVVSDHLYIAEWLANCDREYYDAVKKHLESIKDSWSMPKSSVKCNSCGHDELTEVTLDQSHFFA